MGIDADRGVAGCAGGLARVVGAEGGRVDVKVVVRGMIFPRLVWLCNDQGGVAVP